MDTNNDVIRAKWNEIKAKIKGKWSKLSDEDITKMTGSYDELSAAIQTKYSYQKDQADKEIKDFISTLNLSGL